MLVDRGALVESGQPLVRLDDADLRLKFLQAPAGGPEQQQLQLLLGKLTLKAPIAGVVSARAIEPGELAVAGAPLLTIDRLDEVELILYVSERQIGRVQIGQAVALTTDSFPGRPFPGQVEFDQRQGRVHPAQRPGAEGLRPARLRRPRPRPQPRRPAQAGHAGRRGHPGIGAGCWVLGAGAGGQLPLTTHGANHKSKRLP